MADKPKVNSKGQEELDKVQEQFEHFDEQVKSLSLDTMNKAPILETEQQTKLSDREMKKTDADYIKPARSMACREKFNERYRADWERDRKYVKVLVENLEIIGEKVETWTRPYAGIPAEFWQVPVNKPVYVPLYLAKQLSECKYHRLIMDETKNISADGMGTYYGSMAVKDIRRRIDCRPVGDGFIAMAG